MRSIDQRIDHLKNQILDGLTQKGILNELQSRFLSNVAQFIQTTDYDVFKPHRERRHTPKYEAAEIVVLQYLKNKNMMHTFQSFLDEFKIDEKEIDPDSEKSSHITNQINIEKNGLWIHQIVSEWNKNKEDLIKQNKEYNRKMVESRLQQIDEKTDIVAKNQNEDDNNNDNKNDFEYKSTSSSIDSSQLKKESIEQSQSSINNPNGIDPSWVINEDTSDKIDTNIQEEEDSDSQKEKLGQPIWIIDSSKVENNIGSSDEFVSDDDEPPSMFAKQEKSTEKDIKQNNTDINSVDNTKPNEKTIILQNDLNDKTNNQYSKQDNKSESIKKSEGDDNGKDDNDFAENDFIDNDFVDVDNKSNNNDKIEYNSELINSDTSANNQANNKIDLDDNNKNVINVTKQDSFDFDMDVEFEDDSITKTQIDDKETKAFENKDEKTNIKKDKLLSDDFEEPEKTKKKDSINDDFDFYDDFDEEIEKKSDIPSSKTVQNKKNAKASTSENKNVKSILSSGSDIDFDIDTDPPAINSNTRTSINTINKANNQNSDASLDFSSGSFDEDNNQIKKTPKQTKKVGSNSSIDFDIDFFDSPTQKSKSNKKEQNNNVNESNKSDFDDFDDDSM